MSRRAIGLVAAAAAVALLLGAVSVVLLGRHWLEDWNDEIDRRWAPLRPALDARYQKLEAFEQQFRDEYGVEQPFNRRISRLLDRWHQLYGQRDIEQENEVDTANALEQAARRLVVYLQATTEPRPSPELTEAMFVYSRSAMPIPALPRYNRATEAYEETRDSVLGAPAAHLLAYYGRSRLGLTVL